MQMHISGQIIATSHDLTPKWWFSKGNPLISGKSRLVKYYNWTRCILILRDSPSDGCIVWIGNIMTS